MQRGHVTVGQKQIGYRSAEAPVPGAPRQPLRTLVLLHAFPLSSAMWDPQLEAVPAGWRIIAPDYRGFGESSAAGAATVPALPAPTMNDLAGDVIDLLDRLDIHEVVVAG